MGFIEDIVGGIFGGGQSGGKAAANIDNPTSADQIINAYNQQQAALNQQRDFVNALGGMNGIQNQQNVFNQLQGVANGTGPNPAMAQLNNTTGQNIQNQAALMASQRGVGSNAGLLARQAGMQGGALQQHAAGQGAALQAQQSLGALGQLGNLATNQVGQQANALSGYNTAALQGQNNLLGAQGNYNASQAGLAQGAQKQQGGLLGSIAGAAAPLAGLIGSAFTGGASAPITNVATQAPELAGMFKAQGGMIEGPQSRAAQFLKGGFVPGKAAVEGNSLKNDKVKAMLSPGEIVLPRTVTKSKDPAGNAAKFVAAVLAKKGGRL